LTQKTFFFFNSVSIFLYRHDPSNIKTIDKKSRAALLANLARLRQSAVFSFTPFFVRVRSAQLLKVGLFIDFGWSPCKIKIYVLHAQQQNKFVDNLFYIFISNLRFSYL
jgi:hypothetical protein